LLAQGLSLQALNNTDSAARTELLSEALRYNELAEKCDGEHASRALWAQRAELTALLGKTEEAEKLLAKAEATPLRTAADYYVVATADLAKGQFQQAMSLLAKATDKDPQDFWAWFLLGACHDNLAQSPEAIACYKTCIALAPNSPWAYLNRGL